MVCGLLTTSALAQPKGFNYDEDKVPHYTLPDPLTMENGEKVTDVDTWKTMRRPELLQLFKEHVYGAMPPAMGIAKAEKQGVDENAINGLGIRKEVALSFRADGSGPKINVLILLPENTKGPVPVFLGYNFNGNHTVHADPGIRLSHVYERKPGSKPQQAKESTRGTSASRWQVEKILSRGYGLVTVYYGDVDPDFYDEFKNGVHVLYPEYQNRDDNWTAIGGWAWGLHRVLDYLETERRIDAKRVAVIGHSRLGKTSLWTGATDERFALVISNDSGCGGAALARRHFGETVARINTSFPHWFCKTHKMYNENENKLPVDQHELIALIVPRPVYVASAEDDKWADPKGEFLSCLGADPVYKLYGKEGLPTETWPEVNHPISGTIGYHVRSGKHDVTAYDWEQYLDFADKHLRKGK
ncbi:MAG: acetylxylan esterase [Planctomycetaceae bacterium]|nr:acetylxylan esterase [Planctomycetaceae bacterium]